MSDEACVSTSHESRVVTRQGRGFVACLVTFDDSSFMTHADAGIVTRGLHSSRRTSVIIALLCASFASAQTVDWPVYQGNSDHTHYTTLGQITPQNARTLTVAWTYETHQEFPGSELQNNPVVI